MSYVLNGPTKATFNSSSLNGGWQTIISSTDSASLQKGIYFWQAFATKGSERITLGSGRIEAKANLSTEDQGFDGRSQARKDLDAVQAAMRAIVSGGAVQEYKIGNRELRKMSMADLITLESKYKLEVSREERKLKMKNGEGDPFTLKVRF